MLQSLRNKGFEKIKSLFIKQDEKIKRKFGKSVGNVHMSESPRESNYNSIIFGGVLSTKNVFLNIQILKTC